ncbi:hypothetical protein GCM10009550_24650 [Actinocorallia libanotica]|uniref:Insertion element IS402-like domain-containing protein n=1 Tax=Actinocorallia libanotica TaxID=46162 RepID=A0ABN1QWA6_9ACTN
MLVRITRCLRQVLAAARLELITKCIYLATTGDSLLCGGLVKKGEQPPWIVSDGLWERIEPLLPKVERRRHHPGRRRLDDRKALCGILFVLHTGSGGSSCPVSWASVRA